MPVTQSCLSEHYPAVPASIPTARWDLMDFAGRAGLASARVDDVRLAASEALTNVVLHSYGDRPGEIHVSAAVVASELWLLIGDDGFGLRVRDDRPGLGLGLALIAQASDDFTIVPRAGGGTELRMRFGLSPGHGVDARDEGARRSPRCTTFSAV